MIEIVLACVVAYFVIGVFWYFLPLKFKFFYNLGEFDTLDDLEDLPKKYYPDKIIEDHAQDLHNKWLLWSLFWPFAILNLLRLTIQYFIKRGYNTLSDFYIKQLRK